jgi:hypothetical protein
LCAIAKNTQARVTTGEAETSTFPARWFDGLLRALPGVRDLVSHRRFRIFFRKLNASQGASGPHAFAVRNDRRSSRGIITSIASRLTIVTTRSPLFIEAGRRHDNHVFPKNGREIFFAKRLDTNSEKSVRRANQVRSEERILLRQKHFLQGAADGRGPRVSHGNCIGPEYNCAVDILPVQ